MKIENLKKMKDSGINIPEFQDLQWDDIVKEMNMKNILTSSLKNDSEELKSGVDRSIKPWKLNLELNPDIKYAVRSSCNLEDNANYSFAGLFDTYLNVDSGEVSDHIIKCLKSLYNKEALEYIEVKNIDVTEIKMNVIVQEMVDAEFSGIIFTANPQGVLNEMIITVGRGLGEEVVGDKVDTTTYYYNTSDKKYFYDGEEDLLSTDILDKLLQISEQIKKILDFEYADIEFAIKDDEIFILQSRKITSIDDSKLIILDNSNIVESYPNITLPLSISFAKVAYSGVFKGLAKRIVKNKKITSNYEDIFENMVADVNGAMYYNIDNWYTMLQLLPFGKKVIPIWQEMLGVQNKKFNDSHIKISGFTRAMSYLNWSYQFFSVPKKMEQLNLEYEKVNRYFNENFSENISNEKLIALYMTIKDRLFSVWDITLINDMYAFLFTHLAKKKGENSRISGIKDIQSMKPAKEIIKLSLLYKEEGKSKKYEEQRNKYIELYGDRTLEELKLETRTFKTNPELLDKQIQVYVKDEAKLEEIRKNIMDEPELEIKGTFFEKRALVGIKNREISRLNRTNIYGMVRKIFDAIGKNLERENLIEDAKDIYYLQIEEVIELVKNSENTVKYEADDVKIEEKLIDIKKEEVKEGLVEEISDVVEEKVEVSDKEIEKIEKNLEVKKDIEESKIEENSQFIEEVEKEDSQIIVENSNQNEINSSNELEEDKSKSDENINVEVKEENSDNTKSMLEQTNQTVDGIEQVSSDFIAKTFNKEVGKDSSNIEEIIKNNEIEQVSSDFVAKTFNKELGKEISNIDEIIKNNEIEQVSSDFVAKTFNKLNSKDTKQINSKQAEETSSDIGASKEENVTENQDIVDKQDEDLLLINEDLKNKIKNRKKDYETYKNLPIYNRIVATPQGLEKIKALKLRQKEVEDIDHLTGTPCSSGKIEGEVVVVDSISEIQDVKNKIIVAKMTDPGWVFLLINAKGIITEKGSLLSHTAIISRELKIPSIVAVSNVTQILKTGDLVEMDADMGVIRRIRNAE